MTAKAVAAARANDCPTVEKLDAQIDDLDPVVHDTVFMHEASIARCRGRAWVMTKAASTAAKSGDCAKTKASEVQLRALDTALHDAVFVQDAEIARCLATPDSPTAPGEIVDPFAP